MPLAYEIEFVVVDQQIILKCRFFVVCGNAGLEAAVRRLDIAIAVVDTDNCNLVFIVHHHNNKILSAVFG